MNVALFSSAFYPSVGGVEELVRQLAHEQRRRGSHPLVVTNQWPRDLPASEEYEGLPVRRYPFRVPERSLRQYAGALLSGPGTLRRLCADLRAHRVDLLHVQCVSCNAHYALQAKRRLGLPLVVTLQGELTMDAGGLFQQSAFARDLLRACLTEADAITACSGRTLADAEAFFGRPFEERGRVVYNGIRLADFAGATPYPHPRPYVLGIGRLVPQKGFDLLLRAFAQAVAAGERDTDLLLAGDGVERANLETLAAELGLGDRVRFLGRVDRPEAVRLFTGCRFFVLPSREEPFGIVNLEAMAAGKPVIATAVGGVPEIVTDGANGLLVPGENVEALATGMLHLLRDEPLRDRLAANASNAVRAFDWSAITDQYQAVYEQIIPGTGGSIRVPQSAHA